MQDRKRALRGIGFVAFLAAIVSTGCSSPPVVISVPLPPGTPLEVQADIYFVDQMIQRKMPTDCDATVDWILDDVVPFFCEIRELEGTNPCR